MMLGRDVGLGLLAAGALIAASVALSACGAKKEPAVATATTVEPEPALELNAWIKVPSVPNARYRALAVERESKDLIRIVVERSSTEGLRYTERLVNCEQRSFALVRDAATKEELDQQQRTSAELAPWPPADAADDKIARYACAVSPP